MYLGQLLDLLKSSYISLYKNPGKAYISFAPEASEFFMWTNVFLLEISYFENFLYTAPGQPGGQDFIRGAGPPGPTLATDLARAWHRLATLCFTQ